MSPKSRIKWAKKKRLGRLLCRLFGDDTGGVMMEYVILAVLIAAAVVVAVMFFGKNIKKGFNAMGQTVAGQSAAAASDVQAMKADASTSESESETHRGQISDR
jgi:Flp pilus assembly pilin Flp